jgi:murein DD-endopeptidase MepM/ murein hydrolase activator NlpD
MLVPRACFDLFHFRRDDMLFERILRPFSCPGYRMKLLHSLFLLTVFTLCYTTAALPDSTGSHVSDAPEQTGAFPSLRSACSRFNTLNTLIRDNRIDSTAARAGLKLLLAEVRDEYLRAGGTAYPKSACVFPLEGYDVRAVGGGRQHGYSAAGYSFYSGNRHGGHPSYDIFIRDRNRDSRDDRSGRPVRVRSMTGGVVVALEDEWQPGSALRGGRYLWVYDPSNDLLVYYAHNSTLAVGLGDVVKPGDVIATVGRSGYNAAKRRSPTHLHLTVLQIADGRLKPLAVYEELRRGKLD